MGGKGRIAKQLSNVMLGIAPDRGRYIEPFVGGGGMAAQMGKHFNEAHYSDAHPDLILMWQAVIEEGWTPPTDVSEDRWRELKAAEPSPERGFVGTGGSFGGRWFSSYARGGYNADGTPRNHQAESARAVLRDAAAMQAKTETTVTCRDALTLDVQPGDVVYCDPPYQGTAVYSAGLDHEAFWKAAQDWAEAGATVFVSEYNAPPGWYPVWEQELRQSMAQGTQKRGMAVERLFMWGGADELAAAA